jgi:hypothetical protein
MPPGPPPPSPWRVLLDYTSGKDYYYNITTHEKLWELPFSIRNVLGQHPPASHLNLTGYGVISGGARDLARDQHDHSSDHEAKSSAERKSDLVRKATIAFESVNGDKTVSRVKRLHAAMGSNDEAIAILQELEYIAIVPDNRKVSAKSFQVCMMISKLDQSLQAIDGFSSQESLNWICGHLDVGRDLVKLVRSTTKRFGENAVPGKGLFRKRGPSIADKTKCEPFTHEHCLIIVVLISYGMCFGTDFSGPQLALMMNGLPESGEPIPYLQKFLTPENNPSKNLLTEEMKNVCALSPGPIECDEHQIRRAIQTVSDSDAFPYEIKMAKRGADDSKATGGVDDKFEESQAARRRFQVIFRTCTEDGVSWDSIKDQHPPQPNWKCPEDWKPPSYALSILRTVHYKDETWLWKYSKTRYVWNVSGASFEPNERGTMYVISIWHTKDGISTWTANDHGQRQYCFINKTKDKDGLVVKRETAAVAAASEDETIGIRPTTTANTIDNHYMGKGGVYMWSVKTGKDSDVPSIVEAAGLQDTGTGDGNYKQTMDNDATIRELRHLLGKLPGPDHVLIMDRAPYNTKKMKKTQFDPHASGASLESAFEFLNGQPSNNEFGKLFDEYYDRQTGSAKVKGALKNIIMDKLKKLIPKDKWVTEIERVAAEYGMRKWGCPVLVLFLPARTPSWNPVEMVIAQAKGWFKRNRSIKYDDDGKPVGPMDIDGMRRLLVSMIASITPQSIQDTYGHVQSLYAREWNANDENGKLQRKEHHEFMKNVLPPGVFAERCKKSRSSAPAGTPGTPEFGRNNVIRSGLTPRRRKRRNSDNDSDDQSNEDGVVPSVMLSTSSTRSSTTRRLTYDTAAVYSTPSTSTTRIGAPVSNSSGSKRSKQG